MSERSLLQVDESPGSGFTEGGRAGPEGLALACGTCAVAQRPSVVGLAVPRGSSVIAAEPEAMGQDSEQHTLKHMDAEDASVGPKALLLTREFPPDIYGGAGMAVGHLARALSRYIEVEVRRFGGHPLESHEAYRVRGYAPSHELLTQTSGQRFGPALAALSVDLAMVSDPVDADIVHAHTWYADMAGLWTRILYGVPLAVTLHSLEPLRPWKREQLGAGYELSSWIERTTVESADRIVAVSEAMKADILDHFDVEADRVVVIHNGVEVEAWRRSDGRSALERHHIEAPYILFVGRISNQKGIFTLLEAADGLPAGVQLVLCATSPDTPELEQALRMEASKRRNVLWIGEMLGQQEMVELYSHASVFACPSVYEPFGIINLEAMASEVPVVASNVGGIPEVVSHGETGLLVPPADTSALAVALRTVLADPESGRRMGKAGRERVERHFTWDHEARKTVATYAEMLDERR